MGTPHRRKPCQLIYGGYGKLYLVRFTIINRIGITKNLIPFDIIIASIIFWQVSVKRITKVRKLILPRGVFPTTYFFGFYLQGVKHLGKLVYCELISILS